MRLDSVPFEDLLPEVDQEQITSTLTKLEVIATDCIARTVRENSVLTYSAGIDSSILAELLRRQLGGDTLLTIGRVESSDVRMVSHDPLARSDGFRFVMENIDVKAIEEAAMQVSKIVTVSNLSHFEDCVAFWLAASAGTKDQGLSTTFCLPMAQTNSFVGMTGFVELWTNKGIQQRRKK